MTGKQIVTGSAVLDSKARKIHPQPAPANAGTKQSAPDRACRAQIPSCFAGRPQMSLRQKLDSKIDNPQLNCLASQFAESGVMDGQKAFSVPR
jgi:hypothetical protein